jgi:hypothetical protein
MQAKSSTALQEENATLTRQLEEQNKTMLQMKKFVSGQGATEVCWTVQRCRRAASG